METNDQQQIDNQKLSEQHGLTFAACMVCANKQGYPDSEVCSDCIAAHTLSGSI